MNLVNVVLNMFKVNNEDTATKNYARDQLVRTQNFSKNKRFLPRYKPVRVRIQG